MNNDNSNKENVLNLIPKEVAIKYRVVPKRLVGDTLIVAMEDSTQLNVLDELKEITGYNIHPIEASREDIDIALEEYTETTPFKIEEAAPVEIASIIKKVLRIVSFWILLFLPIVIVFAIISTRTSLFGKPVSEVFNYDGAITFSILWALYGVIIYYVHGLIFPSQK